MTTGGVLGTLRPLFWPRRGPKEPRLGVVTGELWLVAGEETGDDSPLRAEPEEGRERGMNDSKQHLIRLKRFHNQIISPWHITFSIFFVNVTN